MTSKPPASTTCSGRFSSSQSKTRGSGVSGGRRKCLELEVILWERMGMADAARLREWGVLEINHRDEETYPGLWRKVYLCVVSLQAEQL